MQPRASYQKAVPDVIQGMLALSMVVQESGLAPGLIDLVNYRVSQINGCAFCLDMHGKDLRARRDGAAHLHLYNARERAALAWAEAVTRLTNQEVPDEVYNHACEELSETELAQLTLSVVAINGWNRLNVAFCTPAGHYKSAIKQSGA